MLHCAAGDQGLQSSEDMEPTASNSMQSSEQWQWQGGPSLHLVQASLAPPTPVTWAGTFPQEVEGYANAVPWLKGQVLQKNCFSFLVRDKNEGHAEERQQETGQHKFPPVSESPPHLLGELKWWCHLAWLQGLHTQRCHLWAPRGLLPMLPTLPASTNFPQLLQTPLGQVDQRLGKVHLHSHALTNFPLCPTLGVRRPVMTEWSPKCPLRF